LPHIPPNLLAAISAANGSRLAIVMGAGCSIEAPTSMPLSRELSSEAHRRLILEHTIEPGECANPNDLSALATLVFNKTGSQQALVRQFPIDAMRMARANDGYKILIALLLEGAVSHALSLNFDLAPQNAAVDLGETVTVIDRPDELVPMAKTVVYLHGSVNGSSEEYILRTEVINEDWKLRWQEVVARQVLASPNVLFVGLGSAAPVLSETVAMIVEALAGQKTFYQADIGDFSTNAFAQQLGVDASHYIQGSWCDVMAQLARRLAQEQVHTLITAGAKVLEDNGTLPANVAAFSAIAGRLSNVSLLALGRFRANSQLSLRSRYLPRSIHDEEWMAAPINALASISSETGFDAAPTPTGVWHLKQGSRMRAQVLLVTGRGSRSIAALESPIRALARDIFESTGLQVDIVLVGGVLSGARPMAEAAPIDIIDGEEVEDIISGPLGPRILSIDTPNAIADAKEWLNAA
jgi:hypothetical protein